MDALLIEDNENDAVILKDIAASASDGPPLQIVHAASLGAGLTGLRQRAFDVVILDLNLPDSKGLDTLRTLTGCGRGEAIIVITGTDDRRLGVEAVKLGAQDYIVKEHINAALFMQACSYAQERNNLLKEIRRQRETLSAREERFRSLSICSPVGIFIADNAGCFTYVNPRATQLLHVREQEVLGRMFTDFIDDGDREIMRKAWQDAAGCGQEFSEEVRLRPSEGRARFVHVRTASFISDQGTVSGHVGTLEDISDRVYGQAQVEEQKNRLEKVNHELDHFVRTASHDLHAPLRGIANFARLLRKKCSDKLNEQEKDYLEEISGGVTRMNRLIDDLLTLSDIARINDPYEEVDVSQAVAHVKKRMESDIVRHGVTIKESGLPVIACDRVKMEAVFTNLMGNAIKYAANGGGHRPVLDIGYVPDGAMHRFYVKDNGPGIDPKYHREIFKLFKRVHTQCEGTGVGLSIVKRAVEDHGGQVWVESEAGRGAAFYFTIPAGLKHG